MESIFGVEHFYFRKSMRNVVLGGSTVAMLNLNQLILFKLLKLDNIG